MQPGQEGGPDAPVPVALLGVPLDRLAHHVPALVRHRLAPYPVPSVDAIVAAAPGRLAVVVMIATREGCSVLGEVTGRRSGAALIALVPRHNSVLVQPAFHSGADDVISLSQHADEVAGIIRHRVDVVGPGAPRQRGAPLGPDERVVLGLLDEGRSVADVARMTYRSTRTTWRIIARACEQLGVPDSDHEAAAQEARRRGLLS